MPRRANLRRELLIWATPSDVTYSLRILSLIPVPIYPTDHPMVSPYLVCLTVISFYWRIWLTLGQLTPKSRWDVTRRCLGASNCLFLLGWRWCYRRCCGVSVQVLSCSRLASEWARKSNASCNFKLCRHWLFSSLPLVVKPIFLRCARRKREPLIINISYENTIFYFYLFKSQDLAFFEKG